MKTRTLIIPRTVAAVRMNTNPNDVKVAFEKATGHRVVDLGVLETEHGTRCVVILDGIFSDTKTLEKISNYPFATQAWWYA